MNGKQLQALVNGMGAMSQTERAKSQMTLGALIGRLEELDPERLVEGMGGLMSYRGYYSDLSFDTGEPPRTVADLLSECRGAMGKVFEGYKGGDFQMGERTPLWIAPYGSTGPRLMALDVSTDPIRPVTEDEPDHL